MSNGKKVLIVDSSIETIRSIDEFLAKDGFLVFSAFNTDEAVRKAEEINIDVAVINSSSPDIDLTGVSSAFKNNDATNLIPLIVLFNPQDNSIKQKALKAGVDCLLGVSGAGEEVLIAVRSFARVKSLSFQVEHIEDAFYGFVKIIDSKDAYTKGHSERVTKISKAIAVNMSLSKEKIRMLEKAAKLHDVGKIGIPEAILNKPGALTEEEYSYIKMHPVISEKICSPLLSLQPILPVIRHHHERYDGKGYPDGLSGEDIPLEARIIAVADCFDAMSTKRPYRERLPKERIISIFNAGAGSQWDESIAGIFVRMLNDGLIENMALYSP